MGGWGVILKWIFRTGLGDMDWMGVAQDRDRWRALVNAIMILRVPLNTVGIFTSWEPVSFSRTTLLFGVSKCNIHAIRQYLFRLSFPYPYSQSSYSSIEVLPFGCVMLLSAELVTHIEHSPLWNASHITFYSPSVLPRWQHSLVIAFFSFSVDGWQHTTR
jgi:hypothetical protein